MVRADSFLGYTQAVAGAVRMDGCRSEISELPACTAQTLGVRNAQMPQLCRQVASGLEKKEARMLVFALSLGLLSFFFFCFHTAARRGRFLKLWWVAAILDYIHAMDGKKSLDK